MMQLQLRLFIHIIHLGITSTIHNTIVLHRNIYFIYITLLFTITVSLGTAIFIRRSQLCCQYNRNTIQRIVSSIDNPIILVNCLCYQYNRKIDNTVSLVDRLCYTKYYQYSQSANIVDRLYYQYRRSFILLVQSTNKLDYQSRLLVSSIDRLQYQYSRPIVLLVQSSDQTIPLVSSTVSSIVWSSHQTRLYH